METRNDVYIIDFLAHFDDGEWVHDFMVHFDEKDAMKMADYFKSYPEQYRNIGITHYAKYKDNIALPGRAQGIIKS